MSPLLLKGASLSLSSPPPSLSPSPSPLLFIFLSLLSSILSSSFPPSSLPLLSPLSVPFLVQQCATSLLFFSHSLTLSVHPIFSLAPSIYLIFPLYLFLPSF
uniref:Uncharacterized protein n=1 Tax=Cacopsylla melanoneura TaxID=428564 RepID=A0A8D8R392_9HEMI